MIAVSDYSADAELIRVCGEFETLERQSRENRDRGANDPDAERRNDAITSRQAVLEPAMIDLPATTMEALQARARALVQWAPDLMDDDDKDLAGQMTAAILRDLVGVEWLQQLVASMRIGVPTVRPAVPGPWLPADMEVMTACIRLIEKQETIERMASADPFDVVALTAERDELIEQVTNLSATTRSAYVLKARAALAVAPPDRAEDMFTELATTALVDVAAQTI